MTARSVEHATFVITRSFAALVDRVFASWADPARKRRWNACDDSWTLAEHVLDFREGGTERNRTVEPDGTAHVMRAVYLDIVPDQRIVYAYEMFLDDVRISASLVTVTFERVRGKTDMTFTEQVAFLDGHGDAKERRAGTEIGLDRLVAMLDGA